MDIRFHLLVFTYLKAKSYYAIGIYPIYFAFGATFIGSIQNTGIKKYLKPLAVAVPVLLYIIFYNLVYSIQTPDKVIKNTSAYQKFGLLRWEDGKDHTLPQDFADMLGWRELATKVDSICAQIPQNEPVFILCDNYGQAGAINYYTRNEKVRAGSFNADYINWFDLNTKIVNVIRVKEAWERHLELAEAGPLFKTAVAADSITNPLAREYKATMFLFRGPKIDVNKRIKEEIEEERNDQ